MARNHSEKIDPRKLEYYQRMVALKKAVELEGRDFGGGICLVDVGGDAERRRDAVYELRDRPFFRKWTRDLIGRYPASELDGRRGWDKDLARIEKDLGVDGTQS